MCHQKIERALERQQIELQKTLRELRIYKKQHEQWTEVLNKMMEEQVWPLCNAIFNPFAFVKRIMHLLIQ